MERFDLEAGSKRLPVVMDGAHVPFNIGAVLRDLALDPDLSGPCVAIVAIAADKDAQGFVAELGGRASTIVFTDLPGSSRGRPLAGLRRSQLLLGSRAKSSRTRAARSSAALNSRRRANAWLLVTGSLYLIGALRPAIAEAAKARQADPRPSTGFELVEVNHIGYLRERELPQRATTRGQAREFCLGWP